MTNQQKEEKLDILLYGLNRAYSVYPSTYSRCLNRPKCKNPGRGGGLCGDCLETELAKLTGLPEQAAQYHQACKARTMLHILFLQTLDQ